MKILVTGAAGFIGYHVIQALLGQQHTVVGVDNLNAYYDIDLKRDRIDNLGISKNLELEKDTPNVGKNGFIFFKTDITHSIFIKELFRLNRFEVVIHLAAQAGVRYSITNPDEYVKSNIDGFYNILAASKENKIDHLIYASSSSVYGNTKKIPFSIEDDTSEPISLYAATKKANELLAYSYSHLYRMKTTGLRFFTVYGPWGRPDMAYYKFADAINKGDAIPVFNHGNLERDFTYIDDIVTGILHMVSKGFVSNTKNNTYALYNIGNGKPVKLMNFIAVLEQKLGKKAELQMLPMQDGDVHRTWANIDDLKNNYGYTPSTPIAIGLSHFITWHKKYHS